MAGTVYIFNLFNETATLSLNGGVAGTINGWDAQKGYTPSYFAATSVKHLDEATGKVCRGGDGANGVVIQWDSGGAKGTITFPTVEDGVSIDDDLVCYIAKNSAFVEDKDGFVSKAGQQQLKFEAPS
jgi:hypothetical protein